LSDMANQVSSQTQGAAASDLQQFRAQVGQVKQQALGLVEGLSDQAFQWRPGPRRWSIAECFEHLNLTVELYLPGMERAIETAQARGWRSNDAVRLGWLGRWMIDTIEPPAKRRFKAPGAFRPQRILPLSEAMPRFMKLRDELEERLRKAEGLDLQRAKIRSPAMPLVRFSLGETFAIVTTHDRRHLWQAGQVKQSADFPRD